MRNTCKRFMTSALSLVMVLALLSELMPASHKVRAAAEVSEVISGPVESVELAAADDATELAAPAEEPESAEEAFPEPEDGAASGEAEDTAADGRSVPEDMDAAAGWTGFDMDGVTLDMAALGALDRDTAGAGGQRVAPDPDAVTEAEVYYVGESGAYDAGVKSCGFVLKYQADITARQTHGAGQLVLRVPAALYTDARGAACTPAAVGVPAGTPEEPVFDAGTPFNWYADGDDLVFFNYIAVEADTRLAFQVVYSVSVRAAGSGTAWALTPSFALDGADAARLHTLTGRVDTTPDWSWSAVYAGEDDARDAGTKTEDFSLRCRVSFRAGRSIAPYAVEIRVPRALYTYLDGTAAEAAELTVPEGTPGAYVRGAAAPFNWYADGDDYVFFNYEVLAGGTETSFELCWKDVDLWNTACGTAWSLTPRIRVDSLAGGGDAAAPEQAAWIDAEPLTGRAEPFAAVTGVAAAACQQDGKQYAPGLYTDSQIRSFAGRNADVDLEHYVYIAYTASVTVEATQPYTLYLGIGSTAEGVRLAGWTDMSQSGWRFGDRGMAEWDPALYDTDRDGAGLPAYRAAEETVGAGTHEYAFCFVAAYPADAMPAGAVADITLSAQAVPASGPSSAQPLTAETDWTYEPYVWHYTADAGSLEHTFYGAGETASRKGGCGVLDQLALSVESGSDTVRFTSVTTGRIGGGGPDVNYWVPELEPIRPEGVRPFGYVPGRYFTMTVQDLPLYAKTADGASVALGGEDYYYSAVTIERYDSGYDMYEDEPTEPFAQTDVDLTAYVYAMFAPDGGEWEFVASFDGRRSSYTLASDTLARRPYRLMVTYNAADWSTEVTITAQVTLRGDSAALAGVVGGMRGDPDAWEGRSLRIVSGAEQTGSGQTALTAGDESRLLPAVRAAMAAESSRTYLDDDAPYARMRYTLWAADGYRIGSQDLFDDIGAALPDPSKDAAVFYDLLPPGVSFDPSAPVTVEGDGRGVERIELTEDYNGTGRTLVRFTVSSAGESAAAVRYRDGEPYYWDAWELSFGAYCAYDAVYGDSADANAAAFMAADGRALMGLTTQVSRDDGEAEAGDGQSVRRAKALLGGDLDGDGVTQTRGVLFMADGLMDGGSSAAPQTSILARAGSEGNFTRTAKVGFDGSYAYQVTLTNGEADLNSICYFGHLEDAATERASLAGEDGEYLFGGSVWHGSFAGLTLEGALTGATVWYSTARNAHFPTGSETAAEVLTAENGWFPASSNSIESADVKSIAIDFGESVTLAAGETLSFRIEMHAPTEAAALADAGVESIADAPYAYNTGGFYARVASTGETLLPQTARSARVSLLNTADLVVEKRIDEADRDYLPDGAFEFRLTRAGDPVAYAEYVLYTDGTPDDGHIYTTDGAGYLYLSAGQKAVFQSLSDAGTVAVSETVSRLYAGKDRVDAQDGSVTHTFTNSFEPFVYVTLDAQGAPQSALDGDFHFQVCREVEGEYVPAADVTVYYMAAVGSDTVLRTATTDENGAFTMNRSEIAALRLGKVGTAYKLTALTDTGWTYTADELTGTLASPYNAAAFACTYDSKTLYIRKTVTGYPYEGDPDAVFSFRLLDGNDEPVTGCTYVLVEEDGSAIEGQTQRPVGEGGVIEAACAGKLIAVSGLAAGTCRVEEITENSAYSAVTGSATVTISPLAASRFVEMASAYLLRPLTVTKQVTWNDDNDRSTAFAFTVTKDGEPYTGKYYIGQTEYTTTDGTFTLTDGQTAVFADFGAVGESFTVTETANANFEQTPASRSGTVADENDLVFSGRSLVMSVSVTVSEVSDAEPPQSFTFTITKGDAPYTGKYYIGETEYTTMSDGAFTLADGQTAVFKNFGTAGTAYSITQASASDYTQYPDGGYSGTLALGQDMFSFVNLGDSYSDVIILRQRWELANAMAEARKAANGLPDTELTVTATETVNGVTMLESGAVTGGITWTAGESIGLQQGATYLIPNTFPGTLTVAQTFAEPGTYWFDEVAPRSDYDDSTDTLHIYDTYKYYEVRQNAPLTITSSSPALAEVVDTLAGYANDEVPADSLAVVLSNEWYIRSEGGEELGREALADIYETYYGASSDYAPFQYAVSAEDWSEWDDSGVQVFPARPSGAVNLFGAERVDGYTQAGCRFAFADLVYAIPRAGLPDGFALSEPGLEYYDRSFTYNGAERFSRVTQVGTSGGYTLVNEITIRPAQSFYVVMPTEEVPVEGSSLTLRLERQDGASWVPAGGVAYAVCTDSYVSTAPAYPVSAWTDGRTAADGTLRVRALGHGLEGLDELIVGAFESEDYTPCACVTVFGTGYRVVELTEGTGADWGGVCGSGTLTYGDELYTFTRGGAYSATDNVLVNTTEAVPLRVTKELSGGGATAVRFSFRLERVLSLDGDTPSETLAAADLPYSVYAAGTDETPMYSARTDGEGTFELPAGAYARFDLPAGMYYTVTELSCIAYTLEGDDKTALVLTRAAAD